MKAVVAIALILSGSALLPATPALAETGSTICGFTAATADGAIGYVYEARAADPTYTQECDDVFRQIRDKIFSDPTLQSLDWSGQKKSTCESVGRQFISGDNPSADICNKMDAKRTYLIQFNKATNTTSFTK